ncbi:MAG: TolC family protein, partial [Croceibacterium sp.]
MKRTFISSVAAVALAACSFGPKYSQPQVSAPAEFKEGQGWKPATPAQVSSDQPWWAMFADPDLDALEKQVEVSNQNLKAAEAQYRAARAEVGIARGALLPNLGLRASAQRSSRGTIANTGSGGGVVLGNQGGSGGSSTTYSIVGTGSWDIDVWGRIRGQVNADVASAQASAADLAAAKLSAQTELADDYFAMRAAEVQSRLLAQSVEDFTRALQIVRNRKAAGIVTEADIAQAQTQLDTATTQQINASLTRAKMEHAIAMLIGKAPAEV